MDGAGDDKDLENASDEERDTAEEKNGGLGQDGTIPAEPDGLAAGHTGEASTFEPEEDEKADEE